MKFLAVLIFISFSAQAQEIEEAKGLDEVAEERVTSRNENWRHRSYLVVESMGEQPRQRSEFPNVEAGVNADFKTLNGYTFFVDGLVNYSDAIEKTQAYLNQIGIRATVSETVTVATGKERNRRSPGIVVSPSDLLFSVSQLPGQREDRRGEWLVRGSHQLQKSSYDLMYLPFNRQDEFGWPAKDAKYRGTIFRTLQQFENIDLSLSGGQLDEVNRVGLSAQGIVNGVWKTYFEIGYNEKYISQLGRESKNVGHYLAGLSYEGSDDYGVKLEYYYNGFGLDSAEFDILRTLPLVPTGEVTPFLRRQYAIVSLSALEVKNRYNFFWTVIKSLEDSSNLNLGRVEWLLSDNLVGGLTGLFVNGGADTQYFMRPFDQRITVDAKYVF